MRKIITVAGGKKYAVNAYASIRLLRHLGCNLPVDWFYINEQEMPNKWLEIIEQIPNVSCINLKLNEKKFNNKALGGWQAKIEAILNTDADEVLYLDADNFVWRNPEYLFRSDLFKENGAILWKDVSSWEEERLKGLERYFGMAPQHKSQTESGQMLFDKNKCMKALEKVRGYNLNSEKTYKVVYGDKDTFYFGFLTTNTPFGFIKTPPNVGRGCLLQHDMYGEVLFTHLTGGKWSINGRPFTDEESLPHIRECRVFIGELRKWLSKV